MRGPRNAEFWRVRAARRRARHSENGSCQSDALALPRVCGGSGVDGDECPEQTIDEIVSFLIRGGCSGVDGDGYPETVLVGEDRDLEDAGLDVVRIIGSGGGEDEESMDVNERAAAAKACADAIHGMAYTQVDGPGDGISYERGLRLVNRTGIYAVVKKAGADAACGGGGGRRAALSEIICDAALDIAMSAASAPADHVSRAAGHAKEAAYDAMEGAGAASAAESMRMARELMDKAAVRHKTAAARCEAASASAFAALSGLLASDAGKCPMAAALRSKKWHAEYTDEFYELSEADRQDVLDSDDAAKYHTLEYEAWLERYNGQLARHDALCLHKACAAARKDKKARADSP